jgi:hypothetical protein
MTVRVVLHLRGSFVGVPEEAFLARGVGLITARRTENARATVQVWLGCTPIIGYRSIWCYGCAPENTTTSANRSQMLATIEEDV